MNNKIKNKVISIVMVFAMVFTNFYSVNFTTYGSTINSVNKNLDLFDTNRTTPNTFYFDSNGNDSSNGNSEGTAWKSLSMLDNITLIAGDKVMLKSGSIFSGTLKIQGNGTISEPVIVEAYGTGAKPIINGTGLNPSNVTGTGASMKAVSGTNPVPNAAIHLFNAQYVTVRGIEVTNISNGVTVEGSNIGDGNLLAGVLVENNDAGTLKGITLDDIYVHDVTGFLESNNTSKMTGGIGFAVTNITEENPAPRFEDIIIENCTIERVNSTGIFFDGYFNWGTNDATPNQFYGFTSDVSLSNGVTTNFRPTKGDEADIRKTLNGTNIKRSWNEMKWSNVAVKNNLVTNTGKNAMIIRLTDETSVVEKNIVHNISERAGSGNSVMSRSVYGTTFQYNEVYDNREHHDLDGSGFDADFYSPATIWQYNYSHDNNFGLITFCTVASDEDIIVRYNVSQNERGRVINMNYNFINTEFYNNLFYIGKQVIPTHLPGGSGYTSNIPVIWETYTRSGANYTGNLSYKFYNNIIYSDNNYVWQAISPDGKRNNGSEVVIQRDIDYNIFYGPGTKPSENIQQGIGTNNKYNTDPKLFYPGLAPGKDSGTYTAGSFGANNFAAMLNGYRLRPDSVAIGNGKTIDSMPDKDIFGNTVNKATPDIGPYQYNTSDFEGYPIIIFDDITIPRFTANFEPLTGVIATTSTGTAINDITVKDNTINTNSKGIYHVVYEVTDEGKTTTARRNVIVSDPETTIKSIAPTGDTFVRDGLGNSDTNNSTTDPLALKRAGGGNRIIYYTFDVDSKDINKDDFAKAEIQMVYYGVNGTAGTNTMKIGLFDVSDVSSVDCSTITWNNQPDWETNSTIEDFIDTFAIGNKDYISSFTNPAGDYVIPFASSSTPRGTILKADITEMLKQKSNSATGKVAVAFRVVILEQSATAPYAQIYSLENAIESNKPRIELTFSANILNQDATAKNIELTSNGNIIPLSPVFSSSVKDYSTIVENNINSIDILVEKNNDKATKCEIFVGDSTTPLSGTSVELPVGNTAIKVVITAEDFDITDTYTINVTRLTDGVSHLVPINDTYVDDGTNAGPFDNASELSIKVASSSGTNRISYLTFNVPNESVEKAELQLTHSGTGGGSTATINVGIFETDWRTGIKWGTQPTMFETTGTGSTPFFGDLTAGNKEMGYITQFPMDSKKGGTYTVDITDYVNSKVGSGETEFSFRLVPMISTNLSITNRIHSIESANSGARPKIVLTKGSGTPTGTDATATISAVIGMTNTGNISGTTPVDMSISENSYSATVEQGTNILALRVNIAEGASYEVFAVKDGTETRIKDEYRTPIEAGINNFKVVVTSANKANTSTYTLEITQEEFDDYDYGALNPNDFKTERYEVNVTSDIKFATVDNYNGVPTDLKLDMYTPVGASGTDRPLIVFVHGGGFRDDSKKEQGYIVELCTRFAKLGYVTTSIDYRLRKASDMPTVADEVPAMADASEDLDTAIKWLRANSSTYGYNPNYIFVSGGSAGGRTTVGYAYSKMERNFDHNGLIAIANLWGSPEQEFDTNYEIKKGIATFIIHGDNDPTIDVSNARRFRDLLIQAGSVLNSNELVYMEIPNGTHSLDNMGNSRYAIIVPNVNKFFINNLKSLIKDNGYKPPNSEPSDGDNELQTAIYNAKKILADENSKAIDLIKGILDLTDTIKNFKSNK